MPDKFCKALFSQFDELLINFGSYNFGDFVGKRRTTLSQLDDTLNHLIYDLDDKIKK